MSRVKRGVCAKKSRKKILKMASGYRGANRYTIAKQKVEKGLQYQYRDRRVFKRDIRGIWIIRINAALRKLGEGLKYSTFMHNLSKSAVNINRKMLAQIAACNEPVFKKLVEVVQSGKIVENTQMKSDV